MTGESPKHTALPYWKGAKKKMGEQFFTWPARADYVTRVPAEHLLARCSFQTLRTLFTAHLQEAIRWRQLSRFFLLTSCV